MADSMMNEKVVAKELLRADEKAYMKELQMADWLERMTVQERVEKKALAIIDYLVGNWDDQMVN
eukprot:CAMPEP_0170109898 /NCGR_PEP_ID=MMETSP0020_2-20130122/7526_1 /TAXON_ID=98059 /ORGANISM="Dinobryon sp., Strain UTEXLB2267" /LENGTH=63 /DNA_ID=CAMNT_0010335069 /DNA_START=2758 /DNA_END=2949 /DNA_ORIENTATION=+